MNKKIFLVCLLSVFLFATYYVRLQSGNSDIKSKILPGGDLITVGTEGTYAPWTYQNEQGELTGFEIDMWKEIARRIGCSVKFVQMKFSGLFGAMDKGDLDVIANQISPNEERSKKYRFSDPYVFNEIVFLAKAGRRIESSGDMDGWSVVVDPSSNDRDIIKAFEDQEGITLKPFYYDGNNLDEITLGRVDLWCRSLSGSLEAIRQKGDDQLQIIAKTPFIEENAYPFKKDERGTILCKLVNGAIRAMQEDGTVEALSVRHFGIDISHRP